MVCRRWLPYNIPFALLVFGIGQAIAHSMHLNPFFIHETFLFIHSDAVVFSCEKYNQCIQCRLHIVQPLFITFADKCLAHTSFFYLLKILCLFYDEQWLCHISMKILCSHMPEIVLPQLKYQEIILNLVTALYHYLKSIVLIKYLLLSRVMHDCC